MMLYERLAQVQGKSAVMPSVKAPVTLSQELFSSHNGHASLDAESSSVLGSYLSSQSSATIDPVSLSPVLDPVPDTIDLVSSIDEQEEKAHDQPTENKEQLAASPQQQQSRRSETAVAIGSSAPVAAPGLEPSPDMTQRPAATLCPDLQCLSAEVSPAWNVPQSTNPLAAALFYQTTLLLTLSSLVISACCRPVTQIALCLKAGISIPPTPAILSSIIWLITTPSRRSIARISISTTSSTPTGRTRQPAAISSLATPASSRPGRLFTTLRLKMLRKILTCNPMLARPLKDATMRVLRSVYSEEQLASVRVGVQVRPDAFRAVRWSETGIAPDGSWRNKATLPSKEVLLTLLWALQVEEKRLLAPAKETLSLAAAFSSTYQGELDKAPGRLSLKRSRTAYVDNGYTDLPSQGTKRQRRLD